MNLFQVKQYKTFGHTTQIEKQKLNLTFRGNVNKSGQTVE